MLSCMQVNAKNGDQLSTPSLHGLAACLKKVHSLEDHFLNGLSSTKKDFQYIKWRVRNVSYKRYLCAVLWNC